MLLFLAFFAAIIELDLIYDRESYNFYGTRTIISSEQK